MITVPDGAEIAEAYRVEARLGSGAFGTVYRVRHRFLGLMALKLLPCDSEDELERLAREGATHARLSHPNITRVFDVNVTEVGGERALYITTEYMPMGDLDSYLSQVHRLPLDDWAVLARDVLSALGYAHGLDSPVLHRDLKPANILVAGREKLLFKVGDFGVSAEIQDRDQRITAAAGTRVFQAPECAFGSYLVESDIYGAAVVLYRALTGTYPYPIPTMSEDSIERSKQDPPPPSRFRLDCRPELDAVMLRGLTPNPFNRYDSALKFGRAIFGAVGD